MYNISNKYLKKKNIKIYDSTIKPKSRYRKIRWFYAMKYPILKNNKLCNHPHNFRTGLRMIFLLLEMGFKEVWIHGFDLLDYNDIIKKYGPTIIISGDDLRKTFDLKKYTRKDRLFYALSYSKFCQRITNQKINVIISTVSLFHKVRKWNKTNINNYLEIYIKSDIKKIIKLKKKYFYKVKSQNVLGKDIKPEFPKKPDIIIKNSFQQKINQMSKKIIQKL